MVESFAGVDLASRVLVIAEIGNNHEGDAALAHQLVDLAAESGADAVKFQMITPEKLVRPTETARLAQLQRFALSVDDYASLAEAARRRGMMFCCTPFSLEAVAALAPLVDFWKIASGDSDYLQLIQAVARARPGPKPVVISTGMQDLAGAALALATAQSAWKDDGVDAPGVALLHCVSAYPTPPEDANVRAVQSLGKLTPIVGYSDHTIGLDAGPLAVALGAQVVEKHFTISNTHSEFRDHALSLNPADMAEFVARIRAATTLLGHGDKRIEASEAGHVRAVRRGATAARDLSQGHVLQPQDILWVRPADGVSPRRAAEILGRPLASAVAAGDPIGAETVA